MNHIQTQNWPKNIRNVFHSEPERTPKMITRSSRTAPKRMTRINLEKWRNNSTTSMTSDARCGRIPCLQTRPNLRILISMIPPWHEYNGYIMIHLTCITWTSKTFNEPRHQTTFRSTPWCHGLGFTTIAQEKTDEFGQNQKQNKLIRNSILNWQANVLRSYQWAYHTGGSKMALFSNWFISKEIDLSIWRWTVHRKNWKGTAFSYLRLKCSCLATHPD